MPVLSPLKEFNVGSSMANSLEHMNAEEVGDWLTEHGFSEDIVVAFEGQYSKKVNDSWV